MSAFLRDCDIVENSKYYEAVGVDVCCSKQASGQFDDGVGIATTATGMPIYCGDWRCTWMMCVASSIMRIRRMCFNVAKDELACLNFQ